MSVLPAGWRRSAVVGLIVTGVAAGTALAIVPAQAAPAKSIVSNGSAESVNRGVPRGWVKGASGVNTHVLTSVSGGAQSGRKFVRTKITKRRSGAAWWFTPSVPVRGGVSYTYREFYRSGSRTTLNVYFTVGRRVVGKQVAVLPAAGRWKAAGYTVTAPAGATSVRFGHALTSVGFVDVDNISLIAKTKAANPTVKPTVRPTPTPAAPRPTPTTKPPVVAAGTKGLVSLTFDDGWTNQYTNAAPIMKAANMPGTFYLISGYVGTGSYMSVAQAKSLQDAGSEIGSHTVSHQNLTTLDAATLDKELSNSKAALEKNFGPVTSLAYPFGAANAQVKAVAAKYYTNARTTNAGLNARGAADKYGLTIGYVLNNTPVSTIQGWLSEAKANNTWLILCYHGVSNTGSDTYTTSVSNFQAQVNAVKASGLSVVTVRDGLRLTS